MRSAPTKVTPLSGCPIFWLLPRKRVVLSFDDHLHRPPCALFFCLLCLSIPSLRPLVSTKSATLQICCVALSFKWVFFSQVPVSLMDSARREEIFGMVSWFDRLLSVHDLHSVRQMFPCCAPSVTFHHGGLSGEIARFRISHHNISIFSVVGYCALQLRIAEEHIV